MKNKSSFSVLIFFVIISIGAALTYTMHIGSESYKSLYVFGGVLFIAFVISAAIKIANQWDRAIVLRLGHFHSLRGPGLFFIIPVIDTVPFWIDIRVIATSFKAEKTLTKDTVPVDVDAVLFWKVIDPKKAALEVADYESAIGWASQKGDEHAL
jgi:regulator of protease activity HflC (stomatin/prohibitin superfamily)